MSERFIEILHREFAETLVEYVRLRAQLDELRGRHKALGTSLVALERKYGFSRQEAPTP